MSTWQPTMQSVLSSLIVAVILIVLTQAGKFLYLHIGSLAGAINDRWGLRLARKELAQLQTCAGDRDALFSFTIFRFGCWLSILSATLLFSTLALLGHSLIVAPVIFLLCVALYMVAIQTTAVIHWSRNPDKFVSLLQRRIDKLQSSIEARDARKGTLRS